MSKPTYAEVVDALERALTSLETSGRLMAQMGDVMHVLKKEKPLLKNLIEMAHYAANDWEAVFKEEHQLLSQICASAAKAVRP